MLLLDAALRFSSITLLLLTAVLALRDARDLLQGKIAAALCVSLTGMLINTIPEAFHVPAIIQNIGWFLHIPNTIFLWWFGLSLFEDDFKLGRLHWGVLIYVLILMIVIRFSHAMGYEMGLWVSVIANRLVGFAILAHLIWKALSGRNDDLIEARRRTRLWFTLGIAIAALLIITGETVFFAMTGTGDDPDWLSTIRTGIAFPMILFGALWFMRILPETFLFETVSAPRTTAPTIDLKDVATHKRLTEMMENGAFIEQGLTIGALADKIAVPEHQLRALINRGLGFRNFAAFLNSYRIDYAKRILSNPEQARLPVLTIAMDAGYSSLAPFNRAFKAIEGVTPTEYRRQALEKADQS